MTMPIHDPNPISKAQESGNRSAGRFNEVAGSLGYIGGSLFGAAGWVFKRRVILMSSLRHSAWIGELVSPLRDIDVCQKFWDVPTDRSAEDKGTTSLD